jgi:hypothetical protein
MKKKLNFNFYSKFYKTSFGSIRIRRHLILFNIRDGNLIFGLVFVLYHIKIIIIIKRFNLVADIENTFYFFESALKSSLVCFFANILDFIRIRQLNESNSFHYIICELHHFYSFIKPLLLRNVAVLQLSS